MSALWSEECVIDRYYRLLCSVKVFRRVTFYRSFLQTVVEFWSFFGFPRSKQVPDVSLDARYFSYHVKTC